MDSSPRSGATMLARQAARRGAQRRRARGRRAADGRRRDLRDPRRGPGRRTRPRRGARARHPQPRAHLARRPRRGRRRRRAGRCEARASAESSGARPRERIARRACACASASGPSEDKPVDDDRPPASISPRRSSPRRARTRSIEPLRRGGARGITDGDIFVALVTLVTLDERAEPFASIMSHARGHLGLLIERGEFEVAADAAEALLTGEREGPRLSTAQRRRVAHAVGSSRTPSEMRALDHALRLYAPARRSTRRAGGSSTILGAPRHRAAAGESSPTSRTWRPARRSST